MTPRLSIIIPVYNTAEYIDRCLGSIQRIPLKEMEVIAVNDGSTDNSLEKLRQWQDKIPLLHIINQPNSGSSVARNNGLSAANGNYIWFVDSDDWVESDKIIHCLNLAETHQLDILSFGISLSDGVKIIRDLTLSGPENDGIVFSGRDYYLHNYVHASACVAFYRTAFLLENKLEFMPLAIIEDQEFTPRSYFLARRMMYYRDCVYYYFQRVGSKQKSINPCKFQNFLMIAHSLKEFAETNFANDEDVFNCLMGQVAFCVSQALAHYSPGITGHSIEAIKHSGVYPVYISPNLPLRTRLKYFLMNTSLPLFLLTGRLLSCFRKL